MCKLAVRDSNDNPEHMRGQDENIYDAQDVHMWTVCGVEEPHRKRN